MDLELSEQQLELQNGAIEFARAELNDNIIQRDRDEVFSSEGWKKCAAFGVLGLPIPLEYGGMGLGITETIAVMEGLGYGGRDHGLRSSSCRHDASLGDRLRSYRHKHLVYYEQPRGLTRRSKPVQRNPGEPFLHQSGQVFAEISERRHRGH